MSRHSAHGVHGLSDETWAAWRNQAINPYPIISFICSEVSSQATPPSHLSPL